MANPDFASELTTVLARAHDRDLGRRFGLDLPTATASLPQIALSPREIEVYGLVGQGLTNKQIARTLFISEATVKVHVRKILEKVGARTRTEAALLIGRPDSAPDG
jgi:DNA-binding NarL/FixJ family response regulator